MAEIKELRSNDPFLSQLQDDLYAIVTDPKYINVSTAALVGVLEFLKWNLINRS